MGGNAFANGPEALRTPRMPLDIYERTRHACKNELKKLFREVRTPIPGPMKADYGDIDFIVCGPVGPLQGFKHPNTVSSSRSVAADWIAWALKAVNTIQNNAPFFAAHFAVPWPGPEREDHLALHQVEPPPFDIAAEVEFSLWRKRREEEVDHFLKSFTTQHHQYIQVDVRICDTKEDLEWLNFKHSHGPFWQIVGPILRPIGLLVDERGFAATIPQIEPHNKKLARLYLSKKPQEAMETLGMSFECFMKGPFASERDMFEYITECRSLWVRPPEPLAVQPLADDSISEEPGMGSKGPEPNSGPEILPLKETRRKDVRTAPAVDHWHQEFVPSLRMAGFHRTQPSTSREEVLAGVLTKFRLQDEYDKRMTAFLKEHRMTTITRLVRTTCVPLDPSKADQDAMMYRGALIKAMIRVLNHGDDAFGVLPPEGFSELIGADLENNVFAFIEEYKEVIGEKAMADSKERMRAAVLRKRAAAEKEVEKDP